MTRSALAANARLRHVPEFEATHGYDALELAEAAGLVLDPWQADVIVGSMGVRPDGKWSAFEVGLEVGRQNGKDAILEVRTLAGLYLIGERLITFSAHQFDTSLEAFRRLLQLVEEADLQREIKRVSRSHGEEGIELKTGQRVRYRTRTKGGGRGFSGDCLILNEAMIIPESAVGAVFPTLAARPNPQVFYMGSAVDKLVHEHGTVFARVRSRGRAADPRLAWWEFGAHGYEHPDEVPAEAASDPEVWAQANPALGVRIAEEYIAAERGALSPRTFAVERLGVGDWPSTDANDDRVITDEAWNRLMDRDSKRSGPVCFVFDVSPDGSSAAIAVGGHRADGLEHVEIVEHRKGTAWLEDRLVELDGRHEPEFIECDGRGPAASFAAKLENRNVRVEVVDSQGHAQACQSLIDAVEAGSFRHLGTPELQAALRGAETRPLGDSWAWARKTSSADISPLVAFTLARRRAELMRESVYESRGVLTIDLSDD